MAEGRLYRVLFILFGFVLWGLPAASQSNPPKPLFAADTVISLTIEAPFEDFVKTAKRSTDPYPAAFLIDGEPAYKDGLTIAARGKSRRTRGVCRFPPIRVRFDKRPKSGLFEGQKSLKLVTHCKDKDSYEESLLLEYAAYRLFNALTPYSHRVRLARVTYVDPGPSKTIATRYGFFIEDADDTAARSGMMERDEPGIRQSALDAEAAARVDLFHYLIGNLDFSLSKAASGSDCCHNTKLIARSDDPSGPYIPVPYDFDNTGWVDPDYELLPGNLDVRNLQERVFRGFCSRLDAVKAHRPEFLAKRGEFDQILAGIPDLSEKRRGKAGDFMDDFFDILEDPDHFDRRIVKACR